MPTSPTKKRIARWDTVRFRVSPAEREAYETAAAAAQRTLSDWIRITANAAASEVKKGEKK